jgi:hypothetical protein
LAELQALNSQRRELEEKVETANRIISGSASLLSDSHTQGESRGEAVYVIIRQLEGKTVEQSVAETTALRPGDIVKVYRPHDVLSRPRADSAPVKRFSTEARGN